MVVDASAVIAIALNEADAGRLATAIFSSSRRLIAMPTVLETPWWSADAPEQQGGRS